MERYRTQGGEPTVTVANATAVIARAQTTIENAERRMYEAMRERDEAREQLRGAVEKIKALRGAANPGHLDPRDAAYSRGYLAAIADALEVLVGGR